MASKAKYLSRLFHEYWNRLTLSENVTTPVPWLPDPRDQQWWIDRHHMYVANSLYNPQSVRVLFYGDSITEWWAYQGRETYEQYFAPLGIANYAIASDKCENVLWRIQHGEISKKLNPAVCVLKIGTNNLFDHDEAQIARGIKANVEELRKRLPYTKILVLGILPRGDENGLNDKIIVINDLIKDLDNGDTVRYLDMMEHFYRGGNDVIQEYFDPDLLHISAKGYQKWHGLMWPLFYQMLRSEVSDDD